MDPLWRFSTPVSKSQKWVSVTTLAFSRELVARSQTTYWVTSPTLQRIVGRINRASEESETVGKGWIAGGAGFCCARPIITIDTYAAKKANVEEDNPTAHEVIGSLAQWAC